ncbi:MAG TPA: NUDIX domain-containing protein [Candidatus Acidoferrales bacterium]|nr:NUDIX domain-containing protein [Candidatus Acidoferrales bacterium]
MATRVVAGLIAAEGKVLACRRRADAPFPLKWEFPGGKVEEGEEEFAALERELREELGIQIQSASELVRYCYRYPDWREVELIFFRVRNYQGNIQNLAFHSLAWVLPEQLGSLDFLAGDGRLVEKLKRREIEL